MNINDFSSEEEFQKTFENLKVFNLLKGGKRVKSINRSIKRGIISDVTGELMPKRPFHNKKNTSKREGKHSRQLNEDKKKIYAKLRECKRGL